MGRRAGEGRGGDETGRDGTERAKGGDVSGSDEEALRSMERINQQSAHVWMVRTFLKHAPEAEEDEELRETPRALYDFCLALGPSWSARDPAAFLKMARKKFGKLKAAAEAFREIQPEVSSHTNFQMAAESLTAAVRRIGELLAEAPLPAPRPRSAEPTAEATPSGEEDSLDASESAS